MLMKKYLSSHIATFSFFYSISIHATGSAEACAKLIDNGLLEQSVSICSEAAEAGDRPSQTLLGELYDQQGDSVNAALWWYQAANAGYQPARNLLAMKYYYGGSVFGPEKGWSKNYPAAFKLWSEDAEAGIAASQFMTGVMYFNGEGVEKDLPEAWFWLSLSLENGYKLATDVLIELSTKITPQQKNIAREKLSIYHHQQPAAAVD